MFLTPVKLKRDVQKKTVYYTEDRALLCGS